MPLSPNYTVAEAAELLRCKERYLEDNLSRLPHQKIGIAVAFDDEDLAAIKDMHRVRPQRATADVAPRTLAQIRPKGARAS
ncbi:hypothetical protein [Streptomyces nymphaeiformis]|jgi:hypothetical protein|uniref:Uncharacterized protein n=1 Tax=Streptomyces nymphaeiformis TaxID=2663842 RepID=A0A7W7UB62_9ACTN|nr:hypothetical protein [Streptomyces nymphaeiformis]MBB4987462.1 hypothetical protein [Streptomyces nymphaeiformis]